jgi:hypothetical protein
MLSRHQLTIVVAMLLVPLLVACVRIRLYPDAPKREVVTSPNDSHLLFFGRSVYETVWDELEPLEHAANLVAWDLDRNHDGKVEPEHIRDGLKWRLPGGLSRNAVVWISIDLEDNGWHWGTALMNPSHHDHEQAVAQYHIARSTVLEVFPNARITGWGLPLGRTFWWEGKTIVKWGDRPESWRASQLERYWTVLDKLKVDWLCTSAYLWHGHPWTIEGWSAKVAALMPGAKERDIAVMPSISDRGTHGDQAVLPAEVWDSVIVELHRLGCDGFVFWAGDAWVVESCARQAAGKWQAWEDDPTEDPLTRARALDRCERARKAAPELADADPRQRPELAGVAMKARLLRAAAVWRELEREKDQPKR